MKRSRKILLTAFAAVFAFGITACGGNAGSSSAASASASASAASD